MMSCDVIGVIGNVQRTSQAAQQGGLKMEGTKNELRWHMYLAGLELPYVEGAKPGEDPARDAEVRRVSEMLGTRCILNQIAPD
jgi:hypothetical protein